MIGPPGERRQTMSASRTAVRTSLRVVTAPTILDLFAGAGGLSIGFELAGFDVVAAVERDADSAQTFRMAHPDTKVFETDIGDLDLTFLRGQIDVVVGGPPCQPWSLGGLRRGHQDRRDGIPQFFRILDQVRPSAFVMENVAGLAQGDTRDAFQRLLEILRGERPLTELVPTSASNRSMNYDISVAVLNAADFEVPQTRKRLFIVGVEKGRAFVFPNKSRGDGRLPWRAAGEVLSAQPVGEPNPSIVTYARSPSLRPDPYHGQLFNGGGRPIDLARPCPTLLASMGGNKTPWVDTKGLVPEYHSHLRAGGRPRTGLVPGARRITTAEAALLQTFPPKLQFNGSRSSIYRQIGNAVPPSLAEAVARSIKRHVY